MKNLLLILAGGFIGYQIAGSNKKNKVENLNQNPQIDGKKTTQAIKEPSDIIVLRGKIEQYVFGSDRKKMQDLLTSMTSEEKQYMLDYWDTYYYTKKNLIDPFLVKQLLAIGTKYNLYYFKEASNLK